MAKLSGEGLDPIVVNRILHFLNSATTKEDITNLNHLQHYLQNHQLNVTNDFFIGEVVAQRILDKRDSLPDQQFTDLAQLSDIDGFGIDKFEDLVSFFSGKTPRPTGQFPKTDLFRFMTIKAPEPMKATGLAGSSVLWKPKDADRLVRSISKTRPDADLPTAEALQQTHADLWRWGNWLQQNRNKLRASDLTGRAAGVRGLSEADQTKIWGALLHTVYHTAGSLALRETCQGLLLGHHVLQHYQEAQSQEAPSLQDDAHWRRLANTTLVLPKEAAAEKEGVTAKVTPPRSIPARDKKHRSIHEGLVAQQEVAYWQSLADELELYQEEHLAKETEREAQAYKKYLSDVEPTLRDYDQKRGGPHPIQKSNPLAGDVPKAGGNPPITFDLPPGEYPVDLIPDFSFDVTPSLSADATRGKLSKGTLDFVQKQRLVGREATEAIKQLKVQQRLAQKKVSKRYQKNIREMRIGTIPIKVKDYHSYAISPDRKSGNKKDDPEGLYFSFNAGYANAFFQNFKAQIIDGNTITDTQPELLSNDSGVILVRLFTGGQWKTNPQKTPRFKATFELDNGKSFEVEKTFHVQSSISHGVLAVQKNRPNTTFSTNADLPGVTRLGIADFRKVEQELCCYVPGEVSHIENIMAREYKEKSTRQLTRSETSLELTSEKEMEELNDTTTTNRFEMHSEVAEVIQRDRNTNFGYNASVNGEYKFPSGSIGASVGLQGSFDIANSTQTSDKNARTYAEEVTRRALERIVQKTTSKRTSTLLKEFEQNFKHGYDNREGDEHVTGVYRWVDKIYKNQVVNYGKRLMYEFMVPEPAEFFYQVFYAQAEANDDNGTGNGGTGSGVNTLVPPTPLSDYGINSAEDIDRSNYSGLAANYGVSVPTPVDETLNVPVNLSGATGASDDKPKSHQFQLVVPPEYTCTRISGSVLFHYKAQRVWPLKHPECYFKVAAAGRNYRYNPDPQGKGSKNALITFNNLNASGSIQVSVSTRRITSFNGSLNGTCTLKDSVFDQWQQDVYDTLASAYQQQLQAYQDAVAAAEAAAAAAAAAANAEQAGDAADRTAHAGLNTQIVLTELKRLCIEMLTRPFNIPMGADFYQAGECDVPELLLGDALNQYSDVVKFFEQVFDWELMAYLFYPYYWAKRCDWDNLMKRQNGKDYFFEQFLQAGMSRVVVPVRPGFEEAIIYFMKTGEIWNGSGLTVDDPLFLSILEEMAEPEGQPVGDPWYTTVPSTLNIIQGRSAYLAEEGLPCCNEDLAGHGPTNIIGSDDLLERVKE